MRILLPFIFFLLSFVFAPAQVPQSFNYQAVARNNGEILKNTALDVRLTLVQGSQSGTAVWSETQGVTTNAYGLFSLEAGSVTPVDVDWNNGPYFLKVEIDLNDGNGFVVMGTAKMLSVPYALQAQSVDNLEQLKIQGSDLTSDSALFEVKRKDGQTVFAVYNEGVRVYVADSGSKGPHRSGFAIGGFDMGKGAGQEYLRVTPDSVRIYIDPADAKGPRGGFAIGGFDIAKGSVQEYLRVTDDSTRVYFNDQSKGPHRSGFAIGGLDMHKGGDSQYFNVSGAASADVVAGKNRVLWYPKKNAFLAGRILVESPDSVGTNSFSTGYESRALGEYSQALGYKARAKGDNSTAIGNNANAPGDASYAFGNYAVAQDSGSYAIGSGATASGLRSFALGSTGVDSAGVATSPTMATADYAYAFGMGSEASGQGAFAMGTQNKATGDYSLALGYNTVADKWYATAMGYRTTASGYFSTAMGRETTASKSYSTAMGYGTNAIGYFSTAMGQQTTASGYSSTAMGRETTASKSYSTAMGYHSQASGDYSTAMGYYTTSIGQASTAMGYYTTARGQASTAMGMNTLAREGYSTAMGYGTNASGYYSTAMSRYTTASGYYSTAMGLYTTSQASYSLVLGRYNIITGNSSSWVATDPLFVIGNGSSTSNRANAFEVRKNGYTQINITNSTLGLVVVNTSSTGTDNAYAIRSIVARTGSGNYYSGYFSDYYSGGNYYGLYADVRSGGAIDIAEYIYDSRGDTGPGDVVVADPDKKQSVLRSSAPYQTSCLGVISTQPHMVMGMELVVDPETGEEIPGVQAARLALNGRVPVKVTDENGAIRPGDLLTTSSTPGYAMRWSLQDISQAKDFDELKKILAENERRRNAIIGKAVEALPAGTGKILVLISLQ